jgi:hypothetical protein
MIQCLHFLLTPQGELASQTPPSPRFLRFGRGTAQIKIPILYPLRTSSSHHRLSDGGTGSVGEHASSNVHRLELLEQELGCVWDMDLSNLCLVLARTALKRLLGKVPGGGC